MKLKRENIRFLLKYSGLGLILSIAIYLIYNELDINAVSILFLAVSFIISSYILREDS